jgi:hypothetical protein
MYNIYYYIQEQDTPYPALFVRQNSASSGQAHTGGNDKWFFIYA